MEDFTNAINRMSLNQRILSREIPRGGRVPQKKRNALDLAFAVYHRFTQPCGDAILTLLSPDSRTSQPATFPSRVATLLLTASLATTPLLAQQPGLAPTRAQHAMVACVQRDACDVGVAILKQGGNAVDAAVAVGFALAVTYPFAGNLGGGGFMLIRDKHGHSHFLDYREKAPAAATRDMYLDADGNPTRESVEGWRSSGIPGTVRGFELAQSKYGLKKWAELIAPAIALASK